MLFSLLSVLATDCDSGLNAELTYYTLSPDFSISAHGTVFPAGRLDYERPNHLYEFVVMAVDSGDEPHSGTATVRVRMANVNDEAPEFSQLVWAALSLIPFTSFLQYTAIYSIVIFLFVCFSPFCTKELSFTIKHTLKNVVSSTWNPDQVVNFKRKLILIIVHAYCALSYWN